MKYILIFLFLAFTPNIYSQNIVSAKLGNTNQEFTKTQMESIQKRWDKKQTIADVILLSGDTVSGQLIYANSTELIIYPSNKLMINSAQFNETIHIPINSINRVIFKKNKKQSIIRINPNPTFNNIKQIEEYSLYKDTVYYTDINQMWQNSAIINKAFPKKRIRLYYGLSAGASTTEDILTDIYRETGLPDMAEYSYCLLNFDLINISLRIANRYIIGGSIFIYGSYYSKSSYNNSTANTYLGYYYIIDAHGTSIYSDYIIKPIDKYFTRRTEFTVGAGFLFLRPKVTFEYENYSETDGFGAKFIDANNVFGLQLRAAASYYIFPGMSISAGLQANIYQNKNIDAIALNQTGSIVLPAHTLKFSSLRATFGIALHL